MLRPIQLTVGLLLLIIIEVLKAYFVIPFPGSQRSQTLEIAYFLHNNIFYLRIIGWLIIMFPVLYYFTLEKVRPKVIVGLGLIVYLYVFYRFNYH